MRLMMALPTVLLSFLSHYAWAGEGLREGGDGVREPKGWLLRYQGYGDDSPQINQSVEIPLYLNALKEIPSPYPSWVIGMPPVWTEKLQEAEATKLTQVVTIAMGLWQYSPHVRLRFKLAGWRNTVWIYVHNGITDGHEDATNLIALALGRTWTYIHPTKKKYGPREIQEFDVLCKMSEALESKSGRSTMATMLGFGLGFNRSLLAGESLMSGNFDGPVQGHVDAGVLGPDDLSIAAELYPDHRNRLSNICGVVHGIAMREDGKTPFNNAYVGLHTQQGKRIVHRISGYRPNSAAGSFRIFGVPEGVYRLVVAPIQQYGEIYEAKYWGEGWWYHMAGIRAPEGIPTGMVTEVVVKAGQVTDVGYVLAGVERIYQSPSLVDALVKIPLNPKYHRYWVSFWSWKPWRMAHHSGEIEPIKAYKTAVPNGWNAVKIWGKYGWWPWDWEVIQDWKWVDCNAREAVFQWDLKKFGDFEGEYWFELKREPTLSEYVAWGNLWERSYRIMTLPGLHKWKAFPYLYHGYDFSSNYKETWVN